MAPPIQKSQVVLSRTDSFILKGTYKYSISGSAVPRSMEYECWARKGAVGRGYLLDEQGGVNEDRTSTFGVAQDVENANIELERRARSQLTQLVRFLTPKVVDKTQPEPKK